MDDCEAYFNQIYDATYPRILRWAVIKTSCAEDAADLVQEVYQRFYARIKKHGTRDINSAEAYLSGLMRRELATHYRQKSKKSTHESPLDGDWQRITSIGVSLGVSELAEYNGVPIPREGSIIVPYQAGVWNEDAPIRAMPENSVTVPIG